MYRRYRFSRPGFSRIDSRPLLSEKDVKSKLRTIKLKIRSLKQDIEDKDLEFLGLKLKQLLDDWDDLNLSNWVKECQGGDLEFFYLNDRIERLSKLVKLKLVQVQEKSEEHSTQQNCYDANDTKNVVPDEDEHKSETHVRNPDSKGVKEDSSDFNECNLEPQTEFADGKDASNNFSEESADENYQNLAKTSKNPRLHQVTLVRRKKILLRKPKILRKL